MTVKEICVPPLGGVDEVDVIEVLVKPGDQIEPESPLITLESDKASMDMPSPEAGKVREVLVKVGDKVREGAPVVRLEVPESAAEAPPTRLESVAPKAAPEPATPAQPETALKSPAPVPPRLKVVSETAAAAVAEAPPYASPSVRKFARRLGVDLYQVKGNGPKGRILREDVEDFVKARLQGTRAGTGVGIPPVPEVDFAKFGPVETMPLSRIKCLTGQHLQRAWLNAPQVAQHHEVDITGLEEFRQHLKPEAEARGVKLTLLAFVLKVLARMLREFPSFNASLAQDGQSLVLKRYFHIGVAVATSEGLVVPVIRDVDQKGVWVLAEELAAVSARARAGKLRPDELQGGCFSVSSLGGVGGGGFTPIVNVPEVAILGISRARMQPVWDGSQFVPRLMLPVSLSYDHRVIDGAEGAQFVVRFGELLGDLRQLVL